MKAVTISLCISLFLLACSTTQIVSHQQSFNAGYYTASANCKNINNEISQLEFDSVKIESVLALSFGRFDAANQNKLKQNNELYSDYNSYFGDCLLGEKDHPFCDRAYNNYVSGYQKQKNYIDSNSYDLNAFESGFNSYKCELNPNIILRTMAGANQR
ncbi:hypothetical protein [Aquella oligotrophica]|uniref:Lipoprotein n=1 Tax=Aquella oligotrophica TaxID=2067065 RepID=A0A2I7N7A8_9NEIS|nr:hypothetical protein [Aquella oligotrophica]AUR52357.1 hypothetical protein CUN60_08630 [Aquella oligotrophica]